MNAGAPTLTLRPSARDDARDRAEQLLDELVIAMARRDARAALATENADDEARRDLRPVQL